MTLRSSLFNALTVVVVLGMMTQAQSAAAQVESEDVTEFVTQEQVAKDDEKSRDGLDSTLSTAASVALTSNSDVVGEIDGLSTLFSLGVTGSLGWVRGPHLWQNSLTVNQSWARTPALERFVKNNDQLDYESLYSYFVLEWFGPFARFNLETSAFQTEVVTAEAKDYQITRTDGTIDQVTGVTDLHLAGGFEPLTLNESAGLFTEPVRRDAFTWKVRIGAGARQTFAQGVLATQDDDATDIVEVVELADVFQAGLEGFTGVEGKIYDGRLTYRAGASALLPFLNNDPQDRPAIDLLRWGVHAGLEMSVVEWMAVNYKLNVLKDPQLLDVAQIQNNLLLTFKYTLIKPRPAPEPTPAQKARTLRKEAAEAEASAAKLRQKAIAIEEKAEEDTSKNDTSSDTSDEQKPSSSSGGVEDNAD